MKSFALFLLGLLSLVAALSYESVAGGRKKHAATDSAVPREAIEVYRFVLEHGKPPEGYVGGRVWENRERRLPRGGNYREYDVHPKVRGVNRGAERIIIDLDSRKGWYTGDHYRTFTPIPTTAS
jgi:ribonuclease T1